MFVVTLWPLSSVTLGNYQYIICLSFISFQMENYQCISVVFVKMIKWNDIRKECRIEPNTTYNIDIWFFFILQTNLYKVLWPKKISNLNKISLNREKLLIMLFRLLDTDATSEGNWNDCSYFLCWEFQNVSELNQIKSPVTSSNIMNVKMWRYVYSFCSRYQNMHCWNNHYFKTKLV